MDKEVLDLLNIMIDKLNSIENKVNVLMGSGSNMAKKIPEIPDVKAKIAEMKQRIQQQMPHIPTVPFASDIVTPTGGLMSGIGAGLTNMIKNGNPNGGMGK